MEFEEKDLKYCKINEPSEGIFPTYFLLDLNLSSEQKITLNKLIAFLDGVKKTHTPPSPKPCSECGQSIIPFYMDTWFYGDHLVLGQKIDVLKMFLNPTRWEGDHT